MKQLPPGWACSTLGEICDKPQYGWTSSATDEHQVYRLLRTTDVSSGTIHEQSIPYCESAPPEPDKYLVRSGDIVVSRAGSVGFSALVTHNLVNTVFASYLIRFRPLSTVVAQYIAYYLKSPAYWSQVNQQATGITLKNLNAAKLTQFSVPLPPFAEQRRIVAEIERLFSNLEAAQALLCVAQKKLSLYDASTLKRAFRSGYPLTRIGDVFDVYVGSTPSRSVPEYWGGGIPWVSSGEVAFCRVVATRETISPLGLANSSVKVHPQGTVLLGMIGEGKTRGQAAILDIEAGHNQNSAAIRVSEAGYPPEYLFWFLVSEYERTRNIGSGNNQPALNKSRVEDMRFPLAPLPEQVRIAARLEQAMSVTSSLKQEVSGCLARANHLRQAILKKAFEGKLVPQDPNDEPASILLGRIRATRAHAPVRHTLRKREVHS